MSSLTDAFRGFADEDGAQVIEYALLIALVSIALALGLNSAVNGLSATFVDLADRVLECLTGSTC